MRRWRARAALQHKMCSGGGTNETIGSRPALIDSLDDREGEVRPGDKQSTVMGRGGETRHNNIVLNVGSKFKANHGWSCPETQQSTTEAIVRNNKRMRGVR